MQFLIIEKLVEKFPYFDPQDMVKELNFLKVNCPDFFHRFCVDGVYVHDSEELTRIHPNAVAQECYKVAWEAVLKEPGRYAPWIGFAATADGPDYGPDIYEHGGWVSHAWLADKESGLLVEPTPIARSHYYGFEIPVHMFKYYQEVFAPWKRWAEVTE